MYDYLIVGYGLSGAMLSDILLDNGKKICVINSDKFSATLASCAIVNPITGKYFKLTWRANDILPFAYSYYSEMEKRFGDTVILNKKYSRKINENDIHQIELNLLRDKDFDKYVQSAHIDKSESWFHIPSVTIDARKILSLYYESQHGKIDFINEIFEYDSLKKNENSFQYKNVEAQKIIFAEGYSIVRNPFFNFVEMKGYKGVCALIETNAFSYANTTKEKLLIVPIREKTYWVGSENSWQNLTFEHDENLFAELEKKIQLATNYNYEIIEKITAVRPSVIDRKPFMGEHLVHKNMYVINGFGTKGFLLAPFFVSQFANFLLSNSEIEKEVHVNRFEKYLR